MRLSASRSYERCSCDTTVEHPSFHAASSCPESNESAARSGNADAPTSTLPELRVSVFAASCSPTACRRERRRTQANAELHASDDRSQAIASACRCEPNFARPVGESPGGRTRRTILSDRWPPVGLRTGGLLFFRTQLRIVALFPRFGPSQFDLVVSKHLPDGLDADRLDDLLGDDEVAKLRQRPSHERLAQKVRRAQRCLDNEAALLGRELRRAPSAVFGNQCVKPVGVEVFDNCPDVLGAEVQTPGDVRDLGALRRCHDDLGATHLDPVAVAANDVLKLPSFSQGDISNIQTHSRSPRARVTSLSARGTLYNTNVCMAQDLIVKKTILCFWKRH